MRQLSKLALCIVIILQQLIIEKLLTCEGIISEWGFKERFSIAKLRSVSAREEASSAVDSKCGWQQHCLSL